MSENQLDKLSPLVGEWISEVPGLDDQGNVTFTWLEGGGFLIQHSTIDRPEFPNGISLYGATGPGGSLQQHYFDSRGVHRVYEVTFEDRVLTIFREGPDWPQRYVGELSEDGDTLSGRWERGEELGAELKLDFELNYRRVG